MRWLSIPHAARSTLPSTANGIPLSGGTILNQVPAFATTEEQDNPLIDIETDSCITDSESVTRPPLRPVEAHDNDGGGCRHSAALTRHALLLHVLVRAAGTSPMGSAHAREGEYFCLINEMRVSRDMADRSYFVMHQVEMETYRNSALDVNIQHVECQEQIVCPV